MENKFYQWCEKNLKDEKEDIARHGADSGFSGIIYTNECVKVYEKFEDEIYEMLNQDSESLGYDSVDSFTASFLRKDMLNSPDQRKNLLVWYGVERWANNWE